MSDREDRLRSLLNKVRAKRPDPRETQAADVLQRIRTASGAVPAVQSVPTTPPPAAPATPPPAAAEREESEPLTSPTVESPSRYSSQPPRVERPLSVEPRARSVRPSSGAPQPPSSPLPPEGSRSASSSRPDAIRTESVQPTGQPIVYATDEPEFPRPKTFGDLLELTLSLRPR